MAEENGSCWRADDNGNGSFIQVVLPSGTPKKVKRTEPFSAKLRELAKAAGLKKFSVYVDGSKLDIAAAPNDFRDLRTVEIRKYDTAAF